MMVYDVTIVGAGIIGTAIARELAKYQMRICLLEKNDDIGAGTTKANSGIIHGGYADPPQTVRAKFCARGNAMYRVWQQELNFGLAQTGSFVIGFDEADRAVLDELYTQGKANGVPGLEIVQGEFVRKREPQLNPAITAALYCPSAGIVAPYEVAIALAENAIQNGVDLQLNTKVLAIHKEKERFIIKTTQGNIITHRIINCAGLHADEVADMVGLHDFTILPRRGQYLLFDKEEGERINSVIFQVPTPISKGILVTRTYHGNLLLGPDAIDSPTKDHLDTEHSNIEAIVTIAQKTLPHFDCRKVITHFAGNRAATSNHDFIIGKTTVRGFINVVGIESPGLTAAPAIAEHVVDVVLADYDKKPQPNTKFNPRRRAPHLTSSMDEQELDRLVKNNPEYGKEVCRCEHVSYGEIRDSLQKGVPARSLDAIKRRTRAGMGRCQGGCCMAKIMDIIRRETGIEHHKITKKGEESWLIAGPTTKQIVEK